MTSSTTSSSKLSFVRNIILLEKIKTYLESSDLKGKFNYSLIFSTLSSNYLMFTELHEINLFSFLKESPEFFLKESDNPFSNDITDMNIIDTYLFAENPNYNFLYYILTLLVMLQALVFFAYEYGITESNIDEVKALTFEEVYLYFCEKNSANYYEYFAFDRYFYFPMTCENMFTLTNNVVTKYPTLPDLLGLLKSYEL